MADMSREETIFGDDWPYSKAKSSLLRSAAIVIREKGPRSATLKNVAGKAGVTEPAIFRHFDGVDGVFQSMFVISELFYDKFVSYFDDRKTAGLDRLGAATDKIFATLRDNADFAYLIAKPDPVFRQYEKLRAKISGMDARLRAAVVDCLKEAKSAGQLVAEAEAEPPATAMMGALFQVMYAGLEDIDGFEPRKEGRKAMALLFALSRKPGTETKAPKPKATRKKA